MIGPVPERHPLGNAQLPDPRLACATQRSVTDDDEPGITLLTQQLRKRRNSGKWRFLFNEPTNRDDRTSHIPLRSGNKHTDIHPGGNDVNLASLDANTWQCLRERAGRRDCPIDAPRHSTVRVSTLPTGEFGARIVPVKVHEEPNLGGQAGSGQPAAGHPVLGEDS